MIMKTFKPTIIAFTVLLSLGLGAIAFGHGESGGPGMGHHGRSGMHHRGYDGYSNPDLHHDWRGARGYDYRGNLSNEDLDKLDSGREAFLEATEDLREKIYTKETELGRELDKENPIGNVAVNLQKEISKLQAQLDQKHIKHLMAVRKINPELGKRFSDRGPMGYGRNTGRYCWE
jgi:hypothetical protein